MNAQLIADQGVIRLQGAIDFTNAKALQAQLHAAVTQAGNQVCVDFSAVEHANSVGLSLLLSAARKADAGGARLIFTGLPQQLQSMAAVCGLDDWLAEHAAEPVEQQESV